MSCCFSPYAFFVPVSPLPGVPSLHGMPTHPLRHWVFSLLKALTQPLQRGDRFSVSLYYLGVFLSSLPELSYSHRFMRVCIICACRYCPLPVLYHEFMCMLSSSVFIIISRPHPEYTVSSCDLYLVLLSSKPVIVLGNESMFRE